MKKLIAFTLALLTLILSLTACTGTRVVAGDPVNYIESKIKKSALLIDYVSVSTNGKRKVDISVSFKIHSNDICYFGENAKNIYEAATAAASETGKKIGDLSIRMSYNNEQDYIRWTQIIGSFGDLMHSLPGYTPGGFCTIGKAARYFNYNNKDKFADIINETTITEPESTLSADEIKKEEDVAYIKQQLKDVPTNIKYDISASFPKESPDNIHVLISTSDVAHNTAAFIKLSTYIDVLKNALEHTEQTLETFEFAVWQTFVQEKSIIRVITWTSKDLENGILFIDTGETNPVIEQSCSLEELMNFKVEEFTSASAEPTDSPTS